MTTGRRGLSGMAIAAAIGGPAGYALTASLLPAVGETTADVSPETPTAAGAPRNTVGTRRTGGRAADLPGPQGAVAIRMPPVGSFDLLALEDRQLQNVRRGVMAHIWYQAGIACSGIEVSEPTWLRVTVPIRISSGTVRLLPITKVEAARGAPPPGELVKCLSDMLPEPFTLPGPFGDGRWPRAPAAEGDVLVLVGQKPRGQRAP